MAIMDPPSIFIYRPAYDLLCTKLAMPDDKEEMALTINGRKNKLAKKDFDALAKNWKIPERAVQNIYSKFSEKLKGVNGWIDISFLQEESKNLYKEIIQKNTTQIGL